MRQRYLDRAAKDGDALQSWEEILPLDSLGAVSARLASFSRSA